MSMSDVDSERSLLLGPHSAVAGYSGRLETKSLSRSPDDLIVAASTAGERCMWVEPHAVGGGEPDYHLPYNDALSCSLAEGLE